MEENVKVSAVEAKEEVSTQEKEANVLQDAIDKGEVDSNYGFQEDGVYRVNVDKPPTKKEENAVQEQSTNEVSVRDGSETSEKIQKENEEETKEPAGENKQEEENKSNEEEQGQEVDSPLELIEDTKEEDTKEEEKIVEETVEKQPQPQNENKVEYPENIQKLIDFMQETGGSLEDYVNLNRDYSKMNNTNLVYEYYKTTKPHLDNEDINFLMQKNFSYDEETDESSDIRAKQVLFKEELYNAKKYFDDSKSKYYADLKLSKQNDIPEEYVSALEYYKEQQSEKESWNNQQKSFLEKTEKVFNNNFKGFDFQVEDKKFRFKVDNTKAVKEYQSDLKNFINEFVDKDGNLGDASSYHKALFAGRNADKIASHFYEQGRADAIKAQAKEAKNIDMSPRVDNSVITTSSGDKIRVVSGDSSDKLRIKWTK